jgi:peptidoglycan/xylan/chitin deacetylase (PgdA/CDA1 family)
MNKTPILLYHNFCSGTDARADNFTVTFDNFKEQMEYLQKNDFVAVSLEKFFAEQEYWKAEDAKCEGRETKPAWRQGRDEGRLKDGRKKVILTFDDGDASNYFFAMPLLKEFGFTATFFVTINEIGKHNKVDWSMVYDLVQNGMGVGSHGLAHTFLTAQNNYTVLNELLMSKQILEKYTRKRVDFLSIPQGFYNNRVLTIIKNIGFKAVGVSDAGFNDFEKEDLFLLKRFTMRKNYRLKVFKSIISGKPAFMISLLENTRTVLRKALGWQVYDRLRSLKHKTKVKAEDERIEV